MRRPVDIATAETAAFLLEWLGDSHRRVIEVGAGDGHVAEVLGQRGHEVVAIDTDAESVARARARGVDAREARWPEFTSEPVDAVVFTRSLHHIDDLEGAIARACELVVPKGLVIVEDFAFESLDDAMVGWFHDHLRVIAAATDLDAPGDSFVARVLAGGNAAAIHAVEPHRDLHSWTRMRDALTEGLSPVDARSAPYFYRYLIRIAPDRTDLASVVGALLEAELAAAARGWIPPFGRRFVGRRPTT
ncbi:MAG: class I SAM-dependent methyltransferase [Blastocatellia bacterium]|nr:class I SAM-dependent methyltransferase [Blastocatellia bacterium]